MKGRQFRANRGPSSGTPAGGKHGLLTIDRPEVGPAGIESTAVELRTALTSLLERVAGSDLRQSSLSRALRLDKSLASRIARAVAAGSSMEFLHFVPAPPGLGIVLAAATDAGVDSTLLLPLERANDGFRRLLDSLPGGRADLDAVITDGAEELRERVVRSAGQSIFRGAASLLGYECKTSVSSLLCVPSEDPEYLDAIEIKHGAGFRRLRPTAAFAVSGVVINDQSDVPDPSSLVQTIDGAPIRSPEDIILREYTSSSLKSFEVLSNGPEATLVITEEQAALQTPVTVTSAVFLREAFSRFEQDSACYLLRIPSRRAIRDVFFHDDCHVGAPEATIELPRETGAPKTRVIGLEGRINSIDALVQFRKLGTGTHGAGIRGVPDYKAVLDESFTRKGWDASRFHGYRCEITYPTPFVYTVIWFPMADRP